MYVFIYKNFIYFFFIETSFRDKDSTSAFLRSFFLFNLIFFLAEGLSYLHHTDFYLQNLKMCTASGIPLFPLKTEEDKDWLVIKQDRQLL